MITAQLKINENTIGDIRIVRQPPYSVDLDFVALYRVRVDFTGLDGYPKRAEFYIEHTYGDGALVLTAKAMLESVNKLQRLPVRE